MTCCERIEDNFISYETGLKHVSSVQEGISVSVQLRKKETILSLSSEEIQCRELLIHEMKELRSQTKFGWVMQR